jgi:hypothetical protein
MRTAFVYATDDAILELAGQDLVSVFSETRMRHCTDHVVVLDIGRETDDLGEFHSQVFEYANALPAHKCVDVYFLGDNLEFIERIVTDLLNMGARVSLQLTPAQHKRIRRTA